MNLFDLPALPCAHELTTLLCHADTVRIERIVSTGQTSDWYNQEESEFVSLLQGCALLEYEDRTLPLHTGDCVTILPHQLHRVAYTSTEPPCIWLCVFWH